MLCIHNDILDPWWQVVHAWRLVVHPWGHVVYTDDGMLCIRMMACCVYGWWHVVYAWQHVGCYRHVGNVVHINFDTIHPPYGKGCDFNKWVLPTWGSILLREATCSCYNRFRFKSAPTILYNTQIPLVIYTSHLLLVPPGSASLEITVILDIHMDIGSLQMIHYGMEKAVLQEVGVADMRAHFTLWSNLLMLKLTTLRFESATTFLHSTQVFRLNYWSSMWSKEDSSADLITDIRCRVLIIQCGWLLSRACSSVDLVIFVWYKCTIILAEALCIDGRL